MTTTKNRYLSLAAVAALGLTLAACSGDGDGEETTAPEQGGETTASEAEETTEEAPAASGAECLVGTWEMTVEGMEEQILGVLGGEGEVSVEGTSTLTLDGTNATSDVDTNATISVTVEGTSVDGAVATVGSMVMAYTADDTTITYDEVVSAEGTISTTIAGATQEADLADTAEAGLGQALEYTCSDTELALIVPNDADIDIQQTFTRVS